MPTRSALPALSRSAAILLLLLGRLAGGEADPRLGWWKSGEETMLVEPNRIVSCGVDHGGLWRSYAAVIAWRPDTVVTSSNGSVFTQVSRLSGSTLLMGDRKYTRSSKPSSSRVPPVFTVPQPQLVTDARKKTITDDLGRRTQRIQELLKNRPPPFPMNGTAAEQDAWTRKWQKADEEFETRKFGPALKDDGKWLGTTVTEVGWIDATRFGPATAAQAWKLLEIQQKDGEADELAVAVTESLRATPEAAGCERAALAGLDDRAHLKVGLRQRYGTVVNDNPGGNPKAALVGWLEDRQRVDEFRTTLGLPPLADAMRAWSKEHKDRPVDFADAQPLP